MNRQNTMAGKTAADLVQAIATKLYGEAGAGITDLIALINLVAAEPVRQMSEAATLRRAAAVLYMWEGNPDETNYMGDFNDACAILELLADHAPVSQEAEPEAVRLRDELRERTPSSQWATKGEPDPHGDRYECERAALAMGHLTDDAMANAVFLHGNEQPTMDQLLAGALPPIAYLTAAKDRIRWLSRALAAAQAALAATGKQQVGEVQGDGLVRYGRAGEGSQWLLEPMADGYWTPWHIAAAALAARQPLGPEPVQSSKAAGPSFRAGFAEGKALGISQEYRVVDDKVFNAISSIADIANSHSPAIAARHIGFIDGWFYANRSNPTAQAVDLGPVRSALQAAEALCVCCASVDGYSRSELNAFGQNMRSQLRDALALIDGKAVQHG